MPRLNERSARAIARLRSYTPPPSSYHLAPVRRRAAVLLLLYAEQQTGDLRVLLTIRSAALNSFPGHAALPGGRADHEDESAFETARREANEEVGLPGIGEESAFLPGNFWIEHLCELPCALSVTNSVVRPCVAVLHSDDATGGAEDAFVTKLDAKEVAAVFSARLHNFLRCDDEVLHDDERAHLPPSSTGDGDSEGAAAIGDSWYHGWWSSRPSPNLDEDERPWKMHNFYVPITNQRVTLSRRLSTSSQSAASATARDLKAEQEEKVRIWGESCMGEYRYRVWGLTARMLVDAARIAYAAEPEFDYNDELGEEALIRRYLLEGRLEKERARH
ncbi:hypothetical protein KEM52_001637 [Ascosphaera acerosa]|nr:hypothetical protein KEM52_001637 [Ascosphaera acerosa]